MSRYIDADNLQRHGKRGGVVYWRDIEAQPTADVRENVQLDVCPLYGGACGYPSGECYDCPRHGNFRENVRGEWIKKKGSLWTLATCSVCGELSVDGDKPFCPNCGAEMRGEDNGRDEENHNRV